jgi:hypothetical protein
MRAALFLAAAAAASASAAVECAAGTYWHTRGSVDCGPAQGCPATGGTVAECCCTCHANFYCPGGKRSQPEDACPAGATSPPGSTSAAACTGGPAPPPTAAFSQVHVAYTGVPGLLSVDFVGGAGALAVWTSLDGVAWGAPLAATSFAHPTIGYMSQALLNFTGVARGATAWYRVGSENATAYAVVPIVARPEVFAVCAFNAHHAAPARCAHSCDPRRP